MCAGTMRNVKGKDGVIRQRKEEEIYEGEDSWLWRRFVCVSVCS